MSGKNIYNGCSPEICKMLWFSFPAAINRYMRTKVCMMLFYLIILCWVWTVPGRIDNTWLTSQASRESEGGHINSSICRWWELASWVFDTYTLKRIRSKGCNPLFCSESFGLSLLPIVCPRNEVRVFQHSDPTYSPIFLPRNFDVKPPHWLLTILHTSEDTLSHMSQGGTWNSQSRDPNSPWGRLFNHPETSFPHLPRDSPWPPFIKDSVPIRMGGACVFQWLFHQVSLGDTAFCSSPRESLGTLHIVGLQKDSRLKLQNLGVFTLVFSQTC